MRKSMAGVAAACLMLALAGCNGGGQQGTVTNESSEGRQTIAEAGTPEEVLENMQGDFNDTAQKLYDEQTKMFSEVGDTFDQYMDHVQQVRDWYDLTVSETEALGERTLEASKTYFQKVIDTVDLSDDGAVSDAIDAYRDAIYDDAYDDYYDAIYEDAFDDAYDKYYDGVLKDALDVEDYSTVSNAMSDEYKALSDARSDVYKAISDARSDIYGIASDAYSAQYSDELTMDEIFRDPVVNVEKDESSSSEQASADQGSASPGASVDTEAGSADSGAENGVSPEFKQTMDSYEAFFNEYVDFMKAYQADPTSSEMLFQYADMMSRYSEAMSALDSIDENSLSTADYAYYAEVNARILSKLAEVNQ